MSVAGAAAGSASSRSSTRSLAQPNSVWSHRRLWMWLGLVLLGGTVSLEYVPRAQKRPSGAASPRQAPGWGPGVLQLQALPLAAGGRPGAGLLPWAGGVGRWGFVVGKAGNRQKEAKPLVSGSVRGAEHEFAAAAAYLFNVLDKWGK